MTCDVDASSDGGRSWAPVARALRATSHTVDTEGLAGDGDLLLRVVARSGLDRAEAVIELGADNPPRAVARTPEPGATAGPRPRAEVLLAGPAPTGARLRLVDDTGREIPSNAGRATGGRALWAEATDELTAGSAVRAEVVGAADGPSWSFRIEADAAPPRVLEVTPPDGALSVMPGTPIRVLVSEPLDRGSVTARMLRVVGPDGRDLGGTVSWDVDAQAVVLEPGEPMLRSSDYRVEWGDLPRDDAGNGLVGATPWTFTTASSAWGE